MAYKNARYWVALVIGGVLLLCALVALVRAG